MTTIVITGASSGIGLATTRRVLAEGWRVIGTYVQEPATINHPSFFQTPLDLASSGSIAVAAVEIERISDCLDALVNNAAVMCDYHDRGADLRAIRKTFEVNLFGTIEFTERLLTLMPVSAHIVNISSGLGAVTAQIEDTHSLGYRMSKTSINMYSTLLALRLKKRGILVSALDPGWVNTKMGWIGGVKPDREPEEAAEDIYRLLLVKDPCASGKFWHLGNVRDW